MAQTRDEWLRIKGIAAAAWEQPAADRAAFLVTACGDDEILRREVELWLRSADAASGLYETPVLALPGAAAAVAEATRRRQAPLDGRVGPYRIVRELGHGGMGSVYLAERADGEFDHQVAIKFVNGVPSEPLLRRFRDERRILATLNHPNIAALLDGGTTADGFPYVTMEYVAGVPIDEFCDQQALGITARVALFQKVCEAVQYAHQRLVIHRDIKAANILVAPDGTPKLLDFGIAKIVDAGLGPDPPRRTVIRALTPESASPEQVRGEPITIAADVYALGVLLYRLLTRQSPYGAEPLSEAALVRAICDDVPERPSAALARGAGRRARGSHAIGRDLDSIVLKALRKEPERRYHSVEQFAYDLERYLEGQPVLAAPDTRLYRATKFLERHWLLTVVSAVAAVGVLGGAGVAVYQARLAAQERTRAEQRFAEVRRLANGFMFEFHDAIADLPGSLAARQLVVNRAAEHLDGLARDAQNDVALQRELATANMRLGDILGGGGASNLGDLKGAEQRYATALAIREQLAARADAEPADVVGLAQLHVQLSRFVGLLGDFERAEQHAAAAVAALQTPPAARNGSPESQGQVAVAYQQLGFIQARRGKHADALVSLEASRRRARQLVDADPADAVLSARLARIQTDYAEQLTQAHRAGEAIELLADSRRRLEELVVADPVNKRHRQNLIYALNIEGAAREALGDGSGAVAAFASALRMSEVLLSAEPEDVGAQIATLQSRYALGVGLIQAGDTGGGVARLRETIAAGEKMLEAVPGHEFTQHQVASAWLEMGAALLAADPKSGEACRAIGIGLGVWRDLASRDRLPGESAPQRPRFERLWARCEAAR